MEKKDGRFANIDAAFFRTKMRVAKAVDMESGKHVMIKKFQITAEDQLEHAQEETKTLKALGEYFLKSLHVADNLSEIRIESSKL